MGITQEDMNEKKSITIERIIGGHFNELLAHPNGEKKRKL